MSYRLQKGRLERNFRCIVMWLPQVSRHVKTSRKDEDDIVVGWERPDGGKLLRTLLARWVDDFEACNYLLL